MGKAASLGSLSVPQAWAVTAPSAAPQVALVSAQSTAGAASAVAAGECEVPLAEMALAGMAGRAVAGSAGLGLQQRAATTTALKRRVAPPKPPDDATTPHRPGPRIGIVAELRKLAELRDSGSLTEDKFNQQKQRLLDE
jgi:hypothetical protein